MLHRILRAPAVADPEAGMREIKSNWMKHINELADGKKEEPSGKTTTPERPLEPKPADKPPVSDDAGTDKSGELRGEKPPVKDDLAVKPVDKPQDKPVDKKEDWETASAPKGAKEWDKWKEGRKKSEEKLKAEILTRDTQLDALKLKLEEAEKKANASTELPESVKDEISRKDKEIEELSNRIMVLDVTQHPKFQSYFDGKTSTAIGKAKRLVGEEKAEAIEKIIKLPDGEYKNSQLEEFLGEIDSDLTKSRLAVVLEELDNLNIEKDSEIKRANELRDKINGEKTAHTQQTAKARQELFDKIARNMQDPEKGFAVFQNRPDSPEWNEGVAKRIEAAKGLLFGNDVKPEAAATAAFYAVALPTVMQSYAADTKAWKEEKETLEAKIKELVAAQPKAGTGGHSEDNGEKRAPKPGMKRSELDKNTWANIREMLG